MLLEGQLKDLLSLEELNDSRALKKSNHKKNCLNLLKYLKKYLIWFDFIRLKLKNSNRTELI